MPKRPLPPTHEDKKAKKLLDEIAKKQAKKSVSEKKDQRTSA